MADLKISQMPYVHEPNPNSLIPIVEDGANMTTSIESIKNLVITDEQLEQLDKVQFIPDTVKVGTVPSSEIFNTSDNQATGAYSHAEGNYTKASGDCSHAEGSDTIASSFSSHAEGNGSKATGDASHAENSGTASGMYSHAEGESTAEGDFSHAEGSGCTASQHSSHAEGDTSSANGTASHAEGMHTVAGNTGAHSEGIFTIANNPGEHASGLYNKSNVAGEGVTPTEPHSTVFSIGIGTAEGARANAFEVMANGDIYFGTKGVDTKLYDSTTKKINSTFLPESQSGSTVTVVSTLPSTGISGTIYLVPNSSSRTNDIYDEYIWLDSNKWEFLGNKHVEVDLSDYYTKEEVNTALKSIDLTSVQAYGVEWDITVADPQITRIGNLSLHKSLPIQSGYRGCVAQGNKIMYYLDPNDWSKKEDGTDSVLDGTDGTVRVHTPRFYGKSEVDGNKRRVWISCEKIDYTWIEVPEMLIDAYRSTVLNAVPSDGYLATLPVNSAVSVVSTDSSLRGGNNRAANDQYLDTNPCRSDLGKPRTNISRSTMRTYSRNSGSEMLCYEYYKWIFYWAYVIEYANFNSQATYNANLTSDGFRQGGLGTGVTTWDSSWNTYNGYYPLIPCGYCNEFGNFTGVKSISIPETVISETVTVASKTFSVPRWRGFDNPFGDIWTNLDGIVLQRTEANQPSQVYTTSDPAEFTDVIGSKKVAGIEVTTDGYIKEFDLGETGEIIPTSIGGSATTYKCDYHWCNASYTSPRTLLVGGGADSGSAAGLGCFDSDDGVGHSSANVGFRTYNLI